MEYILESKELEKKYKNFLALRGLSIHVEKGSIYGLIGKNGAGKTTLIRLVCGLQNPTSGSYKLFGIDNNSKDIYEVRKKIGAIVETPSIYLNLTAKENMEIQYHLLGIPIDDEINEILKLVNLTDTGKKKVKNFSLGMKQRLGIAIALVGNPDFIILDEPINGLDPEGIIEVRELILKLNKEKKITILISSHYLDELSKIATHYGFVNKGKIIKEITGEELQKIAKKRIEIVVDNEKECIEYLEENHISYEVVKKNCINLYSKINITKLCTDLIKKNCEVLDITEKNESLENYFINLVGGEKQ